MRGVGWRRGGGALGRPSVWLLRTFLVVVVAAIAVVAGFADATLTFGCGAAVLLAALVWLLVLSADQQRQVFGLARRAPAPAPAGSGAGEGADGDRDAVPVERPTPRRPANRRSRSTRRRKRSSATVRPTRPDR